MEKSKRKSTSISIKIAGLILSESYQRCRRFAEKLHKHYKKKFLPPLITGYLDMDWTDYIQKVRKDIGGLAWSVKTVVVFLDGSIIGGEKEFFNNFRNFTFKTPSREMIEKLAMKEYIEYLNKDNLIYTYIELSLDGDYMGTLLFQLRYDHLPQSSIWFTEFCTHMWFTFRGTKIERVCRRGWFQTGKMLNQLMWSQSSLDDENYSYKHDRRGVLSFVNSAKHKNMFKFSVTFEPAEWMDGKYVAFGRVVEGSDVLRRIENTPCTYEKPDREIVITDCGLARVGLGRAIDPSLRLKGITVGDPHIHLEFFIELIFDKFDQMLFDRLDEEVKKLITDGEWIIEIIWDKIMTEISTKRPPVGDVLDAREKSSKELLAERLVAGLYGLPDIPDKFIRSLLDEAIDRSIKMSNVIKVAKSIVDLLVNLAYDEVLRKSTSSEAVQSLVREVSSIVYGSDSQNGPIRPPNSSTSLMGIALPEAPQLKISLSDLKQRVGLQDDEDSQKTMSTRESVVAFIWGVLMEIVNNLKAEQN